MNGDGVIEIASSDDEGVIINLAYNIENITRKRKIEETIDITENSKDEETVQRLISNENFTNSFQQLIKVAYSIDPGLCMERIIQKSLIPNYLSLDKEYIGKNRFESLITKTIEKIQQEPKLKYSFIKEVCECFKKHKKARFNDDDLIIVDDSDISRTLSISSEVDLIILDTVKKSESRANGPEIQANTDTLPELVIKNSDQNDPYLYDVPIINSPSIKCCINLDEDKGANNLEHVKPINLNNDIFSENAETAQDIKVKGLLKRIEFLKKEIQKYEEMEVNNDDPIASPYLVCDRLKCELLECHRQYCQLTGEEVVPRIHKIKIQLIPGNHIGPVKELEKWLNEHVEGNGEPIFPDLNDVIECVARADDEHNLNLDSEEIYSTGRKLFEHCCRQLKQRRQRRDWRCMKQRVPAEYLLDDPADRDPELMKKLENNKKQAEQKEEDLVDRYVALECASNFKPHKCIKPTLVGDKEVSRHSSNGRVSDLTSIHLLKVGDVWKSINSNQQNEKTHSAQDINNKNSNNTEVITSQQHNRKTKSWSKKIGLNYYNRYHRNIVTNNLEPNPEQEYDSYVLSDNNSENSNDTIILSDRLQNNSIEEMCTTKLCNDGGSNNSSNKQTDNNQTESHNIQIVLGHSENSNDTVILLNSPQNEDQNLDDNINTEENAIEKESSNNNKSLDCSNDIHLKDNSEGDVNDEISSTKVILEHSSNSNDTVVLANSPQYEEQSIHDNTITTENDIETDSRSNNDVHLTVENENHVNDNISNLNKAVKMEINAVKMEFGGVKKDKLDLIDDMTWMMENTDNNDDYQARVFDIEESYIVLDISSSEDETDNEYEFGS